MIKKKKTGTTMKIAFLHLQQDKTRNKHQQSLNDGWQAKRKGERKEQREIQDVHKTFLNFNNWNQYFSQIISLNHTEHRSHQNSIKWEKLW